jgi:LssY C-terminus
MMNKATVVHPAAKLSVAAGTLLAAGGAIVVWLGRERLRRAGHPGRQVSSAVPPTELPLTSYTRHGRQGDPLNVQLMATAAQIGAAFAAAGWYRADELDIVTSARICVDSVLVRKYSTAPVSNLYLYGHSEDLAFERPGDSVRERDHIRLWQTGRSAADGRPIWVGGATRDIRVELARTDHLPTHQIAPDIDGERDLVVADLLATDFVEHASWRPGFGETTCGVNGGGDPWFTDGRVAVLMLANVWVPPVAAHAHGRAGARLVHAVLRLSRRVLPRLTRLPRRLHVAERAGSAASSA